MNAPWNAPISDRFSSLCARVFSPAAAILESEKTLGTRLGNEKQFELSIEVDWKIQFAMLKIDIYGFLRTLE